MKSQLQKHPDNTLLFTISVPQKDIQKTREEVLAAAVQTMTLPGFRKGKAPKDLVEKNLDPERIREEILKKLLPQAYMEAVQEHKVRPIINPKIHISKLDEGKDWEFTATTCEGPEVSLGDYKKSVQKITAKSKIIIPGKEKKEAAFEEIVHALLESVTIKIPDILLEQEVDRGLAQTLDEVKRLGLTLDQYLSSTGKTPEALREEFKKKAQNDITFELALQKIAEEEKITVEQKEIEEALQKAKTDQERAQLTQNQYLLTSVLRQQKTLDFLRNL